MRSVLLSKFLWCALGALIALLTCFPLSWVGPKVLPQTLMLENTRFKGTVWKGFVEPLRDLDSVAYSLHPLKFFSAQPPIKARLNATGLNVDGLLSRSRAQDVSMQINVSALPIPDPRLRGLAGRVDIRVIKAQWDASGECRNISGHVRTDVLLRNRGLFNWTGPELRGPISCGDDGQYQFTLTGRDDVQKINAFISISSDGQYKTDMSVITQNAEAALALPLFGFVEKSRNSDGLEFGLVEQGRWR